MNIYLTQMIFGLVEMPARTITLFTLNRSRKISQLAFLAVGGMACLLTIFVPAGEEPLFKARDVNSPTKWLDLRSQRTFALPPCPEFAGELR